MASVPETDTPDEDYFAGLIVKYNSGGTAQWAKTVVQQWESVFEAVVADSDGDVYVAGNVHGTEEYDFGNDVTLTGVSANLNAIVVKYSSDGTTQWVKSSGGNGFAGNSFRDIAFDGIGHLYAAGIGGSGTVSFGPGVSVTVVGPQGILVKYDTDGNPQWARSVSYQGASQSLNSSTFDAVSADAAGNVWAEGSGNRISRYGFGNGVEVVVGLSRGGHAIIAHYDDAGTAVRAQGIVSQQDDGGLVVYQGSVFRSLAADGLGNVYASGHIGLGEYVFGNGLTTISDFKGAKPMLVRYH